jgi:adenine-specific DNA-methyltransferase
MKYNPEELYDLIIGNPPYFVCKKTDIPSKYQEFCTGRPNIFGLFIIHSLTMLNHGGILAFIIPKSFLNSSYYAIIRNYIKKTCKIIDIIDFKENNDFIDTDQSTFGLIIQKNLTDSECEECKFSIKINDNFIFASDCLQLKKLFEGSTTLEKMGLRVRTGNIVWNEHKEELTNDEDDTLLIYNTNISKDNTLEIKKFKNEEKGQYIKKDGRIDPTLVVNRGNGNSAYKLNYTIIKTGPYLIENHLNEIYSTNKLKKDELLKVYNKITDSFKNPKTQQFIDLFLGNNGLSKTELESIFPIYE